MNKSSEDIIAALNWRYATKKYDTQKKISASDWEVLARALQLSPSSYGLQPWRFLVVQKPELRKKLREVSWGQSIIEDCSHLVVFTTLKEMTAEHIAKHVQNTTQIRRLEPSALAGYQAFMTQKIREEKPLAEHIEWNRRQAYIAMGFLMETAALMRIDSTPIEGLEPDKYDAILDLQGSEWRTVAATALGYRSLDDQSQKYTKSRFAMDDVVRIIS